jgi:4-hydroxyphenylpyruvate dioxygenase-like putative hemolysin
LLQTRGGSKKPSIYTRIDRCGQVFNESPGVGIHHIGLETCDIFATIENMHRAGICLLEMSVAYASAHPEMDAR